MSVVTQTHAGALEGLVHRAVGGPGFDESRVLANAAGGALGMSPLHPFNVVAPMAVASPQHVFNTSGNPGMRPVHAFTVQPPPRDWSKRVHQRSSRVTYTRI